MLLLQSFQIHCLTVLIIVHIISSNKIAGFKTVKIEHTRKGAGNAKDVVAPEVQLKNGLTVVGAVGVTEKQSYYLYYRGIPYAKPPLGALRFKPPVPLPDAFSRKTLYAINDSSPCLQAFNSTLTFGSEDCLYLNIYTPRGRNASKRLLPVMVWVYGGGFQFGDSKYETYAPDYFMDEGGVIIVTFNYRLGIFGFFSTGDLASPGNYGLKDQILALNWVNQNIRAFGGNPKKVTVFGESAGAAAVGYLLQTPLTKGLFQRALLSSGSSLCPWALTINPRPTAFQVARMTNITATNSQTITDNLRKIDSGILLAVAINITLESMARNSLNGFSFGPVVEPLHPGAVAVNSSYENLENGLFQHVPILLGFNSLEGIAFSSSTDVELPTFPETAFVPDSMNIHDPAVLNETAAVITSHYFASSSANATSAEIAKYVSEDEYERPVLKTTKLYSQQRPPVYLYRFSYQGYLGSGNRTVKGVGHAEELPYIWKLSWVDRNATSADMIIRKRMITLWTNFARTGNPTHTCHDPILQNVIWKRTNTVAEGNLAYLDIGNNLVNSVNPNWPEFQWWNDLFRKYGYPPFYTY